MIPASHHQSNATLIVHRTIILSLAVLALTSTVVVWLLWQQEKLHHDRTELMLSQHHTATKLQQQLDNVLANGPDPIAIAQIRSSSQHLWKLHWNATHNRFAGFIESHPTLIEIYQSPPYRLAKRLDRIDELSRVVTVNNPTATRLLRSETNSIFLTGYEKTISELETIYRHKSRWLIQGSLLALPIALLLLLGYHLFVFLPSQKRYGLANLSLRETEQKLDTLARKDPLTDTANRKEITRFLSEFQRNHRNEDEFIALAVIDLDHFQQINDVLGYFAGDAVLREVAVRIKSELRDEDQLGRLDADHFAVVLCGLIAPRMAEAIIDRIQRAIEQTIPYKGNNISVSCTVGASVQEVSALDLAELFKLSDQALLQAKQNRRGSVVLLSDQAQAALGRQRSIINSISAFAPAELFSLAFQPIVTLRDRKVAGCECLLRWTASEPANLQTDELVPILEMYGGIHRVGEWVMEESLRHLQVWQTLHPGLSLFMSINVSALQLEAEDFPQRIIEIARKYDILPTTVSLELTETVAIKHLENGRKQLAQLRNYGFGVSLDDFGTGYSSLRYLKTMPISTVKIDQTFVRDMLADVRDAAIVDSTIQIAKAIGLNVVAEGIDSEAQVIRLYKSGCDYGQGYYFSRPMDASSFEQLIATQSAARA